MTARSAQRSIRLTLMVLITVVCGACAKKPFIDVNYRLPNVKETLTGRTVFVETRDHRIEAEIFNERAKKQFRHFTGLFALALELPDNRQKMLGAYELPMLFETAIKRRLQELGVVTVAAHATGIPVFQLTINRFTVRLLGQKWMADVHYEASLTQDGKFVAREVVKGSAERVRIMGRGGAEKVMGEIFTETINQLHIEQLFSKAKL